MKRKTYLVLLVTLAAAAVALSGQTEVPAESNIAQMAAAPASLENYYPPKAPGPLYLMEMHKLSAPFSGMMSDFFEGGQGECRGQL